MADRLGELSDARVSIWLDDFSRERLNADNLQELIDNSHVVGVTTNPSIFGKTLSSGYAYTDQLRELKASGTQLADIVRTLTTDDMRGLRPVHRHLRLHPWDWRSRLHRGETATGLRDAGER